MAQYLRWPDFLVPLIEIAILWVTFYYLLKFIQGTRGAGVLRGLIVALVLLFLVVMKVTETFELLRIQHIVKNWFVPALVIAVIVIFQPELRRGLIRMGQNPLFTRIWKTSASFIDEIVEAATLMSKDRTGALLAIEREVSLSGFLEGAVRLDADLTSELLETIFFTGGPLHDGAVIIQHGRVTAAGCLFPLTDNPDLAKTLGTRHRAAIGVTEESDCVAVIVSEETGQISIAVKGQLIADLDKTTLEAHLRRLLIREDGPSATGEEAAS